MAVQSDKKTEAEQSVSDQVIYLVRPVQRKVSASLEEAFEPLRITAPQFRILGAIARRDATSSAELAREFGLSPQGMTKQIATLEAQNRVRRTVRENNRRAFELELTPEGRATLSACRLVALDIQERLLVGFTPQERKLLRSFLWRILGGRYASHWLNQRQNGDEDVEQPG